jgi:hypothetical protein
MAEQLTDFEFRRHGRPLKYPWAQWADGKPWRLVAGEDFTVTAEAMRTNARAFGTRNNYTVSTAVVDGGKALIVRFTPAKHLRAGKAVASKEKGASVKEQ